MTRTSSCAIILGGLEWDLGMQRDMDLIREIISEIESWQDTSPRIVKLEGRDQSLVQDHVAMLQSADLVHVTDVSRTNSGQSLVVTDLTWDGHEFAAALKTPTVWESMKSKVGDAMTSLPMRALYEISMSLATEWAKRQVGLAP